MNSEPSIAPRPLSPQEIEALARRMRADLVTATAATLWRALMRPFDRPGTGAAARA